MWPLLLLGGFLAIGLTGPRRAARDLRLLSVFTAVVLVYAAIADRLL